MKKYLLIALIAFGINAKAQITLEHKYDSASDYKNNILMIVKFELLGERYVKINRTGNYISIYDLNHSLTKTISLATFPPSVGHFMILYMSQLLFDTDAAIEFLYGYSDANGVNHTRIYKEDGTCIFIADSLYSWNELTIPIEQVTIYNTQQGTKMILSHDGTNNQAWVYGLPGTLTTAIQNSNLQMLQAQGISNPYPNPTNNNTRVDYTLPNGVYQGEIVFYDLQGKEIKRFKVDRTFDSLLISTTDIPAGTYYYQLQTSSQASGGKKLVVVK